MMIGSVSIVSDTKDLAFFFVTTTAQWRSHAAAHFLLIRKNPAGTMRSYTDSIFLLLYLSGFTKDGFF